MLALFRRLWERVSPTVAPALRISAVTMAIPPEVIESLTPADQFIVSYPRSGNTWLRHLIHEVIVLGHPELPRPEQLDAFQPSVHRPLVSTPEAAAFGVNSRILKSHNIADMRGRRMVYLFRQSADALVSYYHYNVAKKRIEPGTLKEFCRAQLPIWGEHLTLALEQQKAFPDQTLFISYERMSEDTVGTLRRVVNFLGLNAPEEIIVRATENCAFERLKGREEKKKPMKAERQFYRKGRVGGGLEELDPETANHVRSVSEPLYKACALHVQ